MSDQKEIVANFNNQVDAKEVKFNLRKVVDKETGEVLEEIKFQSKQFYDKIISNPKYKEIVYNHLCDEMIFKYNINEALDTDTIIIEEDNEDDY
jgi:hypothetical protein